MIGRGQGAVRSPDFTPGILEALKGLWRRHLMDKVSVDVEQDGSIELLVDDVGLEDLIVEGLGGALGSWHFDLNWLYTPVVGPVGIWCRHEGEKGATQWKFRKCCQP